MAVIGIIGQFNCGLEPKANRHRHPCRPLTTVAYKSLRTANRKLLSARSMARSCLWNLQTRTLPEGSAGWGNPIGLIPKDAKIAMSSFPNPALQTWSDAVTVIDELFHLAGSKGQYDDYQLARAAHGIPDYASQMSLSPQNNVFHPKYTGNASDRYDGGYSSYFHNIARTLCPVAKP